MTPHLRTAIISKNKINNLVVDCHGVCDYARAAGSEGAGYPGGALRGLRSVRGLHHCGHRSAPGTHHVRG